MIEASSLKTLESEIDKFSEDSDFQQICTDLITLIKEFPKIFDVSSRENTETFIKQQLFLARQELYEEYDCEQISPKKADNLTDFQEPVINPYVKSLLQFKTIENLYTSEIRVSPKLKTGHVDMRNVMSKPFCVENLFYLKSEPVESTTVEEFNQNTGNNLESAKYRYYPDDYEDTLRRIYLALVVLDEIHIMPGKFQPESEEGRKLLTHELTHVAQNKTKEFVDHRTREELEEEAEFNERTAESIQDPLVTRTIRGEEVTLPASRWHEVSTEVLDVLVPEWVDYERFKRSPEGYELLKRKYAHWKEHHEDEYRW